MKKLIFVFIALFVVVAVAGYNARKNKNEPLKTDSLKETVITTIEEEGKNDEPLTVTGTKKPAKSNGEPVALAITSFKGGTMEAGLGYNVIRGTTPKNTASLVINGYHLKKYRAGQTKWSYIASVGIGTLKEGKNSYAVEALNSKGESIGTTEFVINFKPVTAPHLPGVGSSLWMSLLASMVGLMAYKSLRKRQV